MRLRTLIGSLVTCCFLITGCVSTTTGSASPEANDTNSAELNYQLGVRYLNSGKFELARDRLERATTFDPGLAKAHSALGLVYESLDNLRLATESYEKAVRVAPRNFEIQNSYAVFLCRQKDFGNARKHFDKAMNHPENDAAEVTMTNAGVCMSSKPDTVRAEAYFRAALERKPDYAEALLQICLLKFREEDYLSSRAFLQRLMASSPPTAGVLYMAARIEDLLGNDRGRTDYEDQLIRSFPTSPEARKVLGSN